MYLRSFDWGKNDSERRGVSLSIIRLSLGRKENGESVKEFDKIGRLTATSATTAHDSYHAGAIMR